MFQKFLFYSFLSLEMLTSAVPLPMGSLGSRSSAATRRRPLLWRPTAPWPAASRRSAAQGPAASKSTAQAVPEKWRSKAWSSSETSKEKGTFIDIVYVFKYTYHIYRYINIDINIYKNFT